MNAAGLLEQLKSLEAKAAEIRASGDYYQSCWLERTAAGGSARGKGQESGRYATLRSRTVKFGSGKSFMYIPLGQIAQVEAAIARGRELTKIERQQKQISAKLDKLANQAERLGLVLPRKP